MTSAQRDTFDAAELAVVLSHYDLGVIESVTEFPRGSRRSPKVGIVCDRGKFLLKRRSSRRAIPDRVRFAHSVQTRLIESDFPAPKLVRTRDRDMEFVQIRDHVYELFEFIPGQPYQRTEAESQNAGALLARFHQLTLGFAFRTGLVVAGDGYHDATGVRTGLCAISSTLSSHDSFTGDDAELAFLTEHLREAYDQAAESADNNGARSEPPRLIHSDWHPGNLLFRNGQAVAVIDYDTLRLSTSVIDVANGALQFSMVASGDPSSWPDKLDEARFAAFLEGYQSIIVLSPDIRNCIADLMIEALIAECVAPIAVTGSVGQWSGYRVLQMAKRKISWIAAHRERLCCPAQA